ncbi:hypothetical protein OG711_38650 (plasmid) [Streptomyces uncialis]|uniref:hypothetical protein n=1 Tax=Streptomyces uncialis TaxID=1048205 RepID=UPI002E32BEF5|nr:hypothetical protein [Streptomyces uncialis]
MAVTELLIADEIMSRLSDKARQEVALNLHKRDCQTCGAPIGEQTPALVVDDCGPFLSATLNHQDCRPSGWYELRSLIVGAHLFSAASWQPCGTARPTSAPRCSASPCQGAGCPGFRG